jgi:hypothetical protein
MKIISEPPDADFLLECFEIASDSPSLLLWKTRPLSHFVDEKSRKTFNTRFYGLVAGSLNPKGYYFVHVGGQTHMVHRLIFKMFNPETKIKNTVIDHQDGNPSNNLPSNLRIATFAQNNINTVKSAGVSFHRSSQKWQAKIGVNGKRLYLGSFSTKEEASEVYQKAKTDLYQEYSPFFA